MATVDITLTQVWQLVYSSTTNDQNVVITPHGKHISWAIDTTTPAGTLEGHHLSQKGHLNENYKDRGFVLQSGENLYLRGSEGLKASMTVEG